MFRDGGCLTKEAEYKVMKLTLPHTPASKEKLTLTHVTKILLVIFLNLSLNCF